MIDKILALIASLTLFLVVGIISYNELIKKDVTILVDLQQNEDPFTAIRQIVPSDSHIKKVQAINREKNQYSVVVTTKRPSKSLIEWFTKSYRVEKAEIKNH